MKQYLYDCHVHTAQVSRCGQVLAREMVRLYKQAGYTGLVITDHYEQGYFTSLGKQSWEKSIAQYLQGFAIAYGEGQKLAMDILLGLELRFTSGGEDYLVYGVDEELLLRYPRLYEHTPKSFSHFSKEHNLLFVQAHPFRPGMRRTQPAYLDGVEVFNGNPRHDSHNKLAFAFAAAHNLLMLSGSDAHQVIDVGIGGIYLPTRATTPQAFTRLLRENRQVVIRQSTGEVV